MELIIRNPALPSKAGKTHINFVPEGSIAGPTRVKEDIALPLTKNTEFHPLAHGAQFLFVQNSRDNYNRIERTVFFGGTDEEPFLVQLDLSILGVLEKNEFFKGNERALYNALKPKAIADREELLGTEAERQGDIFFVPTDISWETAERMLFAMFPDDKRYDSITSDRVSVFGTRHELHGTYVDSPAGLFAEGFLKAPDHADRTLRKVHFLSQTAYLFNPKQAD
jgi:hypothetical protein